MIPDDFATNLLRETTALIEAYNPLRGGKMLNDYLEGVIDARIDILRRLGVESIPIPKHHEREK